jgi:hypothetical protein
LPAVQKLYENYGATAEFFMVYIREAHPSDAWQVASNEKAGVVHSSPKTEAERCELAQTCSTKLEIGFPALVDGLDDATDEAYTGWPERIYVIGTDGRIRYKSLPGPFGFEPEELGVELERLALDGGCR